MNQEIREMVGQALLIDNKRFLYCISFIGMHYITYPGLLTHIVLQPGKFN